MSKKPDRALTHGAKGYGNDPENAEWLKPSEGSNAWAASASSEGTYQSRRWDDNAQKGVSGFFSDDRAYRRASSIGDDGYVATKDGPIDTSIDWTEGEGRGKEFRETFGGMGPVSKGGPPRYAPKTGPRTNAGPIDRRDRSRSR